MGFVVGQFSSFRKSKQAFCAENDNGICQSLQWTGRKGEEESLVDVEFKILAEEEDTVVTVLLKGPCT